MEPAWRVRLDVRRSLLLVLSVVVIALAAACSGDGDGDSGAGDALATVRHIAQTAAAAGTQASEPSGRRATETPVPLLALSGRFDVRFVLQGERPSDEHLRDSLEMPDNVDLLIGEGTVTISGRSPFISVTGTLADDGTIINATGTGSLDTFPDVSATFEGTLEGVRLTGAYTLTGATLPGGPFVFEVDGQFD